MIRRSLSLVLLGVLVWTASVAEAAITCPAPAGGGCPGGAVDAWSVGDAHRCLCTAAPFANEGEARAEIAKSNSSFETVLPNDYSSTRYDDGAIEKVLRWGRADRTVARDAILFEAAFRQASAHGMFGDDRLVRALFQSLSTDTATSGEPVRMALVMLDSRVCRDPSTDDFEAEADLCQSTGADCQSPMVCAAERTPGDGPPPFGAVQEYRRAERALATALRTLGLARFRELDLGQAHTCGGVGCAARLWLRLAALRARAQAERVEALWRRAVAGGGVAGKTRAFQLLQEAADEALSEASGSLATLSLFSISSTNDTRSDVALMQSSLVEIAQAAVRSENGVTPFGLPADYVPFLSGTQKELLGCGTSVFECLLKLLDNDTLGVFENVETSVNRAALDQKRFADAVRNWAQTEGAIGQQYKDVLVRMFGETSCEPDCSCSLDEQLAGRCVQLEEIPGIVEAKTWVVEGITCDDPDDPFAACSVAGVDGELERQLEAINNAALSLQIVAQGIDRNLEQYEATLARFAALSAIANAQCEATQAAVRKAANATSTRIRDRINAVRGGAVQDGILAGASAGAGAFVEEVGKEAVKKVVKEGTKKLVKVGVGAAIGVVATGGTGLLAVGGAALVRGIGSFFGSGSAKKEKAKDLEFQQDMAAIENEKALELSRIQCVGASQTAEVTLSEALFQVETERQRLFAQAKEQQRALLQAEIAANQLLVEIRRARERFDEARSQRRVWEDADFQNPQNYRPLVLENLLNAAQEFRTAQLVTWLVLRASAYDLAQPDFTVPKRFTAAQTLGVPDCNRLACNGSGPSAGQSCIDQADCASGTCAPTGGDTGMADSDHSCSLRAVFAARTVDDLRSLVGSAFRDQVGKFRQSACSGNCDKTIRLRNIFTDASNPGSQPSLGSVLVDRIAPGGDVAVLDFAITTRRGFKVCPTLPGSFTLACQPEGVAGLGSDVTGAGEGSAADDVYGARIRDLRAVVRFRYGAEPNVLMCRTPQGRPVGPNPAGACLGKSAGAGCLPGQCRTAGGTPVACQCGTISEGQPVVNLLQLGPGVLRSALAERGRNGKDSLLSYRLRQGDLPLDLRAAPQLRPFEVTSLALGSTLSGAPANEDAQGVPLASPHWQLQLTDTNVKPGTMREFLASIEDIELTFRYRGFNL